MRQSFERTFVPPIEQTKRQTGLEARALSMALASRYRGPDDRPI
jgi:hypothetical protein